MTRLIPFLFLAMFGSMAHATDHNEPDLLNSFYRDRDGSGADIYHVFAYPDKYGVFLNLALTLAPVPDTGRFDPNSVQRIYLRPTIPHDLLYPDTIKLLEDTFLDNFTNPILAATKYKKYILDPIIKDAGDMFGLKGNINNLPIDQKLFPEIMITYSKSGMKAKITFKNFEWPNDISNEVIVESSGKETDPSKLKILNLPGANVKIFVGGRDDAFFSDIGGFFRSINWKSALNDKREFEWEGSLSYLDTAEAKETNRRVKNLIEKNTMDVVYSGKDLREGNNVNTIAFVIPVSLIIKDVVKERQIRIWAESFLTDEAYKKITIK